MQYYFFLKKSFTTLQKMRTMKKKWQKVLTSFASLIFFDIQITELLLCWLRSLLKSLISFVPENLHLFHAES